MENERKGKGREGSGDSSTKKKIKCGLMKNELYGGCLMSARHTDKPVENGKAFEGAHNGNKFTLQLLTLIN